MGSRMRTTGREERSGLLKSDTSLLEWRNPQGARQDSLKISRLMWLVKEELNRRKG